MPSIRRDADEFPSKVAAHRVADLIEGARVIAGDRYGQVFYVEDAAGKRIPNPEPPLKVNPLPGRPDTSFGIREAAQAEADRRGPPFVVMQHRVYGTYWVIDPTPPISNTAVAPADPLEIFKPTRGGVEMTAPDAKGNTHYTGQRRHGLPNEPPVPVTGSHPQRVADQPVIPAQPLPHAAKFRADE